MRRTLAGIVVALVAGNAAAYEPIRDVNVGPAVTIDAPATYSAGTPIDVTGILYAQAALPVVFEAAVPVPQQRIDVLVDESVAGSATTADDGSYHVAVTLGATEPTTHMIRAIAYRGTAIETSSRSVTTSIDQLAIEMRVEPATAVIAPGQTLAMSAFATTGDGREVDVTASATWTSSNPAVATVSGGVVTGVGPGDATITAAYQGSTASAAVSVA